MESAPNTDTPTKRTSGSMETVQQFRDCAKPVASRVEFCVYQCAFTLRLAVLSPESIDVALIYQPLHAPLHRRDSLIEDDRLKC